MIRPQAIALLVLSFLVAVPIFGQWPSVLKSAGRAAGQTVTQSPTTTPRTVSNRPPSSGEDRQIIGAKRAYDVAVTQGNDQLAAGRAVAIGMIYERKEDYPSAADWYRTGYAKGNLEGSDDLVDLVLLDKIKVENPENIRPFVEIRALCGSHIARAYVLNHWKETPQQIKEYPMDQKFTACSPVGPGDRMEANLWQQRQIAHNQRVEAQESAEYYRQHPDQDPKVKERKAAEGAAILLGALLIQGANMPATGPGSIACNRYQNHYPGANDSSVCNVPPSK